MFSIRLLKWACITECSGLWVIGSHQQTNDKNEWIIVLVIYLSWCQNCLHNLQKEWWNIWMDVWPAYHDWQLGVLWDAQNTVNGSSEPQSQTWCSNYKIAADVVCSRHGSSFATLRGKPGGKDRRGKTTWFRLKSLPCSDLSGMSSLWYELSGCWTLSQQCKQEG